MFYDISDIFDVDNKTPPIAILPAPIDPEPENKKRNRFRKRPRYTWRVVCRKVRVLDRDIFNNLGDLDLSDKPIVGNNLGYLVALIGIPLAYYLGTKNRTIE
jgi:hypothetical protein